MRAISDTTQLKKLVGAFPWLPWMFLRIYVYPVLVRGERKRSDLTEFFDGLYAETRQTRPLDDASTISPEYSALHAAQHYNSVEASVLRSLVDHGPVRSVFDIGSGTGHWIDFVEHVLSPDVVVGIDLSTEAMAFLREKYDNRDDVQIHQCDIVSGIDLERRFDLITAIGIMFHIVDDAALMRALERIAELTDPGGRILIGGHFGWTTRDIMFVPDGDGVRVTKRVRSLRWWRRAARKAGLRVVRVERTRNARGILVPENDLLILEPMDTQNGGKSQRRQF